MRFRICKSHFAIVITVKRKEEKVEYSYYIVAPLSVA